MNKTIVSTLAVLFCFSTAWPQGFEINRSRGIMDDQSYEYGRGTSMGFHILGDGVGLVLRHSFGSQNQLGASLSYSPLIFTQSMGWTYYFSGVMITPEFNVFLGSRIKEKNRRSAIKRKMKKHFISLKAGIGYAAGPLNGLPVTFTSYTSSLTWHQERFFTHKTKKSTGFDLGINLSYYNSKQVIIQQAPVNIFLRWDWAWYLDR